MLQTKLPDYNNCLTNVSNSILKYFECNTYHETLKELDDILNRKEYKNIVLILYDGMGSNILDRHLEECDFLRKYKIKDIDAVFPPTTTASTTSVLSGLNPNEHGWLGWDLYFKEEDEVVSMFMNTKKDTDDIVSLESLANKYYGYKSILKIIGEKYQTLYLKSFGDDKYIDLDDMNNKIVEFCNNNDEKKFIYAYYDEPDHTMHHVGTDKKKVKDLFKKINNSTENLCKKLNDDTLVIILADHGHITCEYFTLSEYPDIFNLLKCDVSIEARACNFFINEEKKEEFEKLFNKYFGKFFNLYKKEEVISKKLFGTGKSHEHFYEALGDYLAVAISNKYLRYNENSVDLISMHAGITLYEIIVPLIVYKGDVDEI